MKVHSSSDFVRPSTNEQAEEYIRDSIPDPACEKAINLYYHYKKEGLGTNVALVKTLVSSFNAAETKE